MDTRNSRKALMREIQETDFAIVETALFLDTHPTNRDALAYYCELKERNESLRKEYSSKCGPLNFYSSEKGDHWGWIANPWPWELDSD